MLNLNGVNIPSFVKVNRVGYSILPTIQNNTLSVRGRKGVFLYGQELSERKIDVDITIIAEENNGVMAKTRMLASWLYHNKPVKLIISDESDKYYLVVPDGSTDVDELVRTGKGTISFLCIDALAYGKDKEFDYKPTDGVPFEVVAGGTAETFPTVDITVSQDMDSIALIHDDGVVMIGEGADVTKTAVNPLPTRFNDHLEYLNGWTEGNYVDNGLIVGSMNTIDNVGVIQEGKNYGTNASGWHGAAKVHALPTPIQDFEITTWLTHKSSHNNQVGRVELYLRDVNGKHIGKFALVDTSNKANTPKFEARAGDWDTGHYFGNHYGPKSTSLSNFYGYIKFSRKGTKWTAEIYKLSGSKYTCIVRKTWTDTGKRYTGKLASVQMHVGAYKAEKVTNQLEISRVMVKEYVELSSTQTPNIIEAGDKLTIDCESAKVYKNGEVFYEGINPSSTFFSLNPGRNGLAVNTSAASVKVRFTERWL